MGESNQELIQKKVSLPFEFKYSEKSDKIYIGMTCDLEKRLFAHNNLPKGWTRYFRPWKLVYSEVLPTKSEALKREKELKSHQGRNFICQEILPE
jgi:putative endonuclease